MKNQEIIIAVRMLAYNHEKYIAQAIESVLMQKTDYKVQLIIAEDCSTDCTREIVKEYQKKYPNEIRLILNEHNMGMLRNAKAVNMYALDADYLASCEGDDYWTDPYKLQKQVTFLENNPEYIGTSHNVRMIDAKGHTIRKSKHIFCDRKVAGEYNLEMAEKKPLYSHTNSLVCRNIFKIMNAKQRNMYFKCETNGDVKYWITLAALGTVRFFPEYMSCYRHNPKEGKSYSARTYEQNMNAIYFQQYKNVTRYLRLAYGVEFDSKHILLGFALNAWKRMIKRPNLENIRVCREIFYDGYLKKDAILYLIFLNRELDDN